MTAATAGKRTAPRCDRCLDGSGPAGGSPSVRPADAPICTQARAIVVCGMIGRRKRR